MPSPVGHLLTGVAIAWTPEALAPRRPGRDSTRRAVTPFVAACAALTLAPDVDLLLTSHRTVTHSAGAAAVTAVVCGSIARALESADITGLWLGERADLDERSEFVIAPRGAAQAVYRNDVRRNVDPALVEQIGPRQYRLRVFPVPPVEVAYDADTARSTIGESSSNAYVADVENAS